MEIDAALIRKVAANARIELSEEEIREFVPQLKDILEHFSAINSADVKGIKPSAQPVEVRNVLRDDVIKKCLSQHDALSLTQHKKDGYFKGPRAV